MVGIWTRISTSYVFYCLSCKNCVVSGTCIGSIWFRRIMCFSFNQWCLCFTVLHASMPLYDMSNFKINPCSDFVSHPGRFRGFFWKAARIGTFFKGFLSFICDLGAVRIILIPQSMFPVDDFCVGTWNRWTLEPLGCVWMLYNGDLNYIFLGTSCFCAPGSSWISLFICQFVPTRRLVLVLDLILLELQRKWIYVIGVQLAHMISTCSWWFRLAFHSSLFLLPFMNELKPASCFCIRMR